MNGKIGIELLLYSCKLYTRALRRPHRESHQTDESFPTLKRNKKASQLINHTHYIQSLDWKKFVIIIISLGAFSFYHSLDHPQNLQELDQYSARVRCLYSDRKEMPKEQHRNQ